MNAGYYVSAAGAAAQSAKMDQVSNNLVNMNSPGFKKDFITFMVRAGEREEGRHLPPNRRFSLDGGGLLVKETRINFAQGPIEQTGRPLDLAITGDDVFFKVRDIETQKELFTRAGGFTFNNEGKLVSSSGRLELLSNTGTPFILDAELAPQASFAEDGQLLVNKVASGEQIGIYKIADTDQLQKYGRNAFIHLGENNNVSLADPIDYNIRKGSLERSGVDAAMEFTSMIYTQRLFEANVDMLKRQDETLQGGIRSIANFA